MLGEPGGFGLWFGFGVKKIGPRRRDWRNSFVNAAENVPQVSLARTALGRASRDGAEHGAPVRGAAGREVTVSGDGLTIS